MNDVMSRRTERMGWILGEWGCYYQLTSAIDEQLLMKPH